MTTAQAAQIAGGTWTVDTNHSLIEFAARHNEIAYVKGRFRKFSGTISVDEQVPFTREFEPGRRVVGDELKVELQIEAKPQQPAS